MICSLFIFMLPIMAFYKGKYQQRVRGITAALCASVFTLMLIYPNLIYGGGSVDSFFREYMSFHTVVFHNLVMLAFLLLPALASFASLRSFGLWCSFLPIRSLLNYGMSHTKWLFCFFVHCVSFAELTIFFDFHSVRHNFFVLSCAVVSLFALCASQGNSCSQDFHLRLWWMLLAFVFCIPTLPLGTQKKDLRLPI